MESPHRRRLHRRNRTSSIFYWQPVQVFRLRGCGHAHMIFKADTVGGTRRTPGNRILRSLLALCRFGLGCYLPSILSVLSEIMGEHKLIMGKDIYFWNFIILMLFTLFEVGQSSSKSGRYRYTDFTYSGLGNPHRCWNRQGLQRWCILHAPLGRYRIYLRVALFPTLFVLLMLWELVFPTLRCYRTSWMVHTELGFARH